MGSWNKSGHMGAACKPCDSPTGHYCGYCLVVSGCGTNIGDGTKAPLSGAVAVWSKDGVMYGSCTTDSGGQCCVRFLGPTGPAAGDGLLDLKITHPGYADYTAIVSCGDPVNPGLTPVVVTMVTLKTYMTWRVIAPGTTSFPVGWRR